LHSTGRVESLADVNALAKPYTIPLSLLQKQPSYRQSRCKQISMAGLSICVVGASLLAMMPQVERAVLSAQAARLASARAAYHPKPSSIGIGAGEAVIKL